MEEHGHERGYTSADLTGLKRGDLVALILRQPDKWPAALGKFNRQKTNMDQMKEALTRADSEFTTNRPGRDSPVAPIDNNSIPTLEAPPIVADQPGSSLAGGRNSSVNIPTPEPRPQQHSILLLIEDTRGAISERFSQRIQVSVTSAAEVPPTGESQVSSREVIDALQASISALKGPARIGVLDTENPGYTSFFATISEPEDQDAAQSSPVLLAISGDRKLNLIVSHIGVLSPFGAKNRVKRIRSESPSNNAGEQDEPKAEPAASFSKKKKAEPTHLTREELDWITEQARQTPGFDEFKQNHNQRLSNPDRIKYWKFAAGFSAKYYKARWPGGIEYSGGATIKKNAIEAALNLGTTMLAQAVNMARILGIYYDGPHRSAEVAQRVDSGQLGSDTPGSESLVNFLTQWERDHPVSSQPL
ncbi:hypothetical protein B0H11DRAFT_1934109 [Mycena galericulata]|nr:hypothetical protein B0H11DRAFT_1934109 [Mycena galericulata]